MSSDGNSSNVTEPKLDAADVQRLVELDSALKYLAKMLKEIGLAQTENLVSRRSDPQDPLCGFGILGWVTSEVRHENPEYDYGDPSYFLHATALNLDFREDRSERRWPGDMEFPHDCPDCLADISPGWLMHELYKTGGSGGPAVSLRDCLRIDTLVVKVTTQHKYVYDLRSRQWLKESPEIEDYYGSGTEGVPDT